jgi:hypothetical protein
MNEDDVVARHRKEMIGRTSPIYGLFDIVEESAFPLEVKLRITHEASIIAEIVISQGLRVRTEVRATAMSALAPGARDAELAFEAWRAALEGARPSRRGMDLVLNAFGHWLGISTADVRGPFLETLPALGPRIGDMGSSGIEQVLTAATSLPIGDARQLFSCLAAYATNAPDVISAVCHIGLEALELGHEEVLADLEAIIPPGHVGESKDSERLITSLAKVGKACRSRGEEIWCRAMNLVLSLGTRNHSSAYVTARRLAKSLEQMPSETVLAYLEDFRILVDAIGIRVVGFSLRELPRLYEKYGRARTHAFVHAAASAAGSYGTTAGQWFYERKTGAAKEYLERLRGSTV